MAATHARRSAVRPVLALLGVLLTVAVGTLLRSSPALGAARLEVTPDRDLDPAGHTVTARGEGYDESKGIYVAWCVVPPPGQAPTPCGGGADQSGESGQSAWISTFPPPYGVGLARPYGPGGSFEVEIRVSRYIGEVDCFVTSCAVVTRNDHTRGGDRSQDVFAPVTFRGQEEATASGQPFPAPSAGGASRPTTPTGAPPGRGQSGPQPEPPAGATSDATSGSTVPPTAESPPPATDGFITDGSPAPAPNGATEAAAGGEGGRLASARRAAPDAATGVSPLALLLGSACAGLGLGALILRRRRRS